MYPDCPSSRRRQAASWRTPQLTARRRTRLCSSRSDKRRRRSSASPLALIASEPFVITLLPARASRPPSQQRSSPGRPILGYLPVPRRAAPRACAARLFCRAPQHGIILVHIPHRGATLCPLDVLPEPLRACAQILVEYGGRHIVVVLPCQHSFLRGVHAADRAAVGGAYLRVPGAYALYER